MVPRQNERPSTYCGPTTRFGKALVTKILRYVLPSTALAIECDTDSDQIKHDNVDYVLHPPTLFQTLYMLAFPDYWVGAHYSKGNWYLSKGDLAEFMRQLMFDAPGRYMSYLGLVSKIRGPYFRLRRYLLDPLESRQVSTHYDLDSELYESFLDKEMIYTCAFFDDENTSLEDAQERKKSLVAERLNIHDGKCVVLL